MVAQELGIRKLSALVRAKRGKRGLREVGREIQVSPATLSRVEQGKIPDLRTFQLICKWLDTDPSQFLGGSKSGTQSTKDIPHPPDMDTVAVVSAHLRADRNLSRQTADALTEVIRLLYDSLAGKEEQKSRR